MHQTAMEPLHNAIERHAGNMPGKVAIVHGQRRVTYGELHEAISRMAGYLQTQGAQKGDRVCLVSENTAEYVAAYLGTQKAGCIAVGINAQYTAFEAERIFRSCTPQVVFLEHHRRDLLNMVAREPGSISTVITIKTRREGHHASAAAPRTEGAGVCYRDWQELMQQPLGAGSPPDLRLQDIAAIIYTSGTTGEPKGVMLSHENFASNAWSIIEYLELTDQDSVMAVLPFPYAYGTSLLTTHLMAGGTLVLENRLMYPNAVLDRMLEERVTGFAGVPSTYAILLDRSNIRSYRFPHLRYLTQAGGAMSAQNARRMQEVLPSAKLFIMYGQTEATARLTYLAPEDVHRKPGSIGKAIPGVTVAVLAPGGEPARPHEEGELVAFGRNIMQGYWNNEADTVHALREGWLHTGDLAYADDEGYLFLVGRKSDMIKSGAHRISPREIEEVIQELDEVHEATVVGVADPVLGEAVRAFVVLKPLRTLQPAAVQRHCHQKLAAFKVPKDVVFVAELPRTTSGKVKRHLLRETPGGPSLVP